MSIEIREQFWLAEYSELWVRYRQIVGQLVANERYALIFSGALWAWVFANRAEEVSFMAPWVPLVVTIFFFVKAHFFLYEAANQINTHIRWVEEKLKLGDLAWHSKEYGDAFSYWQPLFWGSLCLVNFITAIFYLKLV